MAPPSRSPDVDLVALADRLRAAGCVFAEDEARLLVDGVGSDAGGPQGLLELERLIRRRVAGEPLEHLLGWVEFTGLRVAVAAGVFVPRRRSRLLVGEGLAALRARTSSGRPGPAVVVELCCGVAAVAAAIVRIAERGPDPAGLQVHAADIDPRAVACARRNLPDGARTYVGDLYAPLPPALRGRIDVLIANAPYVPSDAVALMPPEARLYEPRVALDGGPDGLDVQRRIIAEAAHWLVAGGRLLIETGREQAPATARTMAAHGLGTRIARDDDLDATVVIGTAVDPAAAPGRGSGPSGFHDHG